MTTRPATPAHYCPACRTTTPATTAEGLVQAGVDHRAECTGMADLRTRIADAIAGHWPVTPNNDGTVICHCGDRVKADRQRQAFREHTADAVLALVQPELDQLRAELDRTRAEFVAARADGYQQAVTDAAEANVMLGRTRATDQLLAVMRDGADLYARHAAIKTATAAESAPTT